MQYKYIYNAVYLDGRSIFTCSKLLNLEVIYQNLICRKSRNVNLICCFILNLLFYSDEKKKKLDAM